MKIVVWEQYNDCHIFLSYGMRHEDRWTLYLYNKQGFVEPMPKYKVISYNGKPYLTTEEKIQLRKEVFGAIKSLVKQKVSVGDCMDCSLLVEFELPKEESK